MRGILAVIVGIIAIAWPGVTILALVILFAIYAFTNRRTARTTRAFSSRSAGPRSSDICCSQLIDAWWPA